MRHDPHRANITGWPAVILGFIPMFIGWAWIITTLIRAVV